MTRATSVELQASDPQLLTATAMPRSALRRARAGNAQVPSELSLVHYLQTAGPEITLEDRRSIELELKRFLIAMAQPRNEGSQVGSNGKFAP